MSGSSRPTIGARGKLVLVATPIGNLGDIGARAAEALAGCHTIACEDTRVTRRLLSALQIPAPRLLAVHEHNELAAADGIVELLAAGDVTMVTDAGTPGISDPGARIVAAAVAAGFEVECIPGPSAFVIALVVSGLPTDRFVFEGFLPRKGAPRRSRLKEIGQEHRTVVLYEAPHRMLETLRDLRGHCGDDRPVSISRELTKRFETTVRGLLGSVEIGEPRGEYVIVLGGAPRADANEIDDEMLRAALAEHRAEGRSTKAAIAAVALATGAPKRRVYELAITGPSGPVDDLD